MLSCTQRNAAHLTPEKPGNAKGVPEQVTCTLPNTFGSHPTFLPPGEVLVHKTTQPHAEGLQLAPLPPLLAVGAKLLALGRGASASSCQPQVCPGGNGWAVAGAMLLAVLLHLSSPASGQAMPPCCLQRSAPQLHLSTELRGKARLHVNTLWTWIRQLVPLPLADLI